MSSLVIIAPLAALSTTEAGHYYLPLGQLLGTDGVLTVALSASGSNPATHYGCHAGGISEYFGDLCRGLYAGTVPPPEGVTQGQLAAILAAITVSIDGTVLNTDTELAEHALDGSAHFDAVVAHVGLQKIVVDLP
jgi:hypothetical protein